MRGAGVVRGAVLFCCVVLSLLRGMPAGAAEPTAAPRSRPSIVLLLADDQRFDTIAALGNAYIRTPNLDSLVRGGTAFRNAYIMGGTNPAVCMPSRAMLLSGRSLFHLKGSGQSIPPDQPTYPELLRRAGYATFATGKWHNGRESWARSFSAGDAIFFGGMHGHRDVPVFHFDPGGKYPQNAQVTGAKYSSELFADAAVEFIRSHKGGQPFYVHLAFTAPHDPRDVPPGYEAAYDPDKIPLPPNFLPRHPFDNGELTVRDEQLLPVPRDPRRVRKELANYYAMITHLDAQVGRVLAALKEAGHADDTIVIFAADNGLALGAHGLLGKQSLYEHSVRVPLVVKGPGVAAERTSDALCYLSDLFPTILEAAGVNSPAGGEGRSLLPALRGGRDAVRGHLFFAYRDFQRGYRDGRYKLIEYFVGGRRTTQLFDLADDPNEMKNLAEDPTHARTLAEVRKALAGDQKAYDDPQAGKWPD